MGYKLFIGFRYLVAKRREKFVSVISLISVMGIAIGVTALIVVIAVMSGFDSDLRQKIIGANAHIVIEQIGGIKDPDPIVKEITNIKHIKAVSPFFAGQAIIKSQGAIIGVLARGIDPDREIYVTRIGDYVQHKPFTLNDGEVVLGIELAKRLDVIIGEEIAVYTAADRKPVKLKVVNYYRSGMYDYDSMMIFVSLSQAQQLYDAKGVVGALAVKLDNEFLAQDVKSKIYKRLGPGFLCMSWMESNKELFSALKLEKTVMFIILALIIIVACFNIASTLIMVVMEKTKDIGILKSIGVTKSAIMNIFTAVGFLLGLIGTVLGTLGGLGLCYILKEYNFIRLPQDIYYIDHLPVVVEPMDVGIIFIGSLVITLLSTLYPAYQASRLNPVEALRYE